MPMLEISVDGVLVVGDEDDVVNTFACRPDSLGERADYPRADAPRFFDRQNVSHTVTCTWTRTFPTYGEALDYLMTLRKDVARQGLVEISRYDSATYWLEDALVKLSPEPLMGCTCICSMTIEGGEILTEKPTLTV